MKDRFAFGDDALIRRLEQLPAMEVAPGRDDWHDVYDAAIEHRRQNVLAAEAVARLLQVSMKDGRTARDALREVMDQVDAERQLDRSMVLLILALYWKHAVSLGNWCFEESRWL